MYNINLEKGVDAEGFRNNSRHKMLKGSECVGVEKTKKYYLQIL